MQGRDHSDPLVPIAEAFTNAGHTVAFAGDRSGATMTEDIGFEVFALEVDASAAPAAIAPLLELDMEHEFEVLRDF